MDDALAIVILLCIAGVAFAGAAVVLALMVLLGAVVVVAWLISCLIMFLRWLWYHLSFAGDEAGTSAGL